MIIDAVFKEEEALKADFGVLAKGEKGDKGDKGEPDYSLVAGALKGSASGNPIVLSDVSPLPHEIKVNVDVNGAVVQKYGLNLFDQETFFRDNGFDLQADGSWIGKRLFKSAFTPPVQIKGPMYIRLKGKNISANKPFYLTVNYVEGGQSTACTLPASMTEMKDFSFPTLADKTVKNIYWNYSGTGGSDGVSGEYYIKDVIFSYADAPYEPYNGHEPLTAKDGTLSILGNGESMTLIAEDGITISAEYNKDTNKVINDIYQKLSALGVAVVNN